MSEDDRRLEKRVDFFDAEMYAISGILENDVKMWEATGGNRESLSHQCLGFD